MQPIVVVVVEDTHTIEEPAKTPPTALEARLNKLLGSIVNGLTSVVAVLLIVFVVVALIGVVTEGCYLRRRFRAETDKGAA